MQPRQSTKCSLDIYCRFLSNEAPAFYEELICETIESEPVAGQTFYLLDRNAEEILKEYKDVIWLFPSGEPDFRYPAADKILGKYIAGIVRAADTDPRKYLMALAHIAAFNSENTPLIHTSYLIAMQVLNSRAIRVLRTDRKGRARTDYLREGIYYACGVFAMDWRTQAWNVRICLKPGENRLTLDNYNAVGK